MQQMDQQMNRQRHLFDRQVTMPAFSIEGISKEIPLRGQDL